MLDLPDVIHDELLSQISTASTNGRSGLMIERDVGLVSELSSDSTV